MGLCSFGVDVRMTEGLFRYCWVVLSVIMRGRYEGKKKNFAFVGYFERV